jgi:mono/diheme cytochrome c family protein
MLVLNGLQGPFVVKGQTYNNAMVPWKQLSDEQIADILTYIRSDWGNNAPAISPEFVTQIRKADAAQSDSWTQEQLLAVPPVKPTAISGATPATK